MEKQLNNKIIIVTGAAGGLGEAMVKALVEAGAKIAAVDISRERLEALKDNFPTGRVFPITADLRNSSACTGIVKQTFDAFFVVLRSSKSFFVFSKISISWGRACAKHN